MKGKRILSAVLSAALLLQLSPLAAFAEDTSLLPVTAQTALTEPAPEEPTPEPAGEETALPEELAPEETAVPMAAPTRSLRQSLPPHRRRRSLRRTLRKRLPRSRLRNPRQPLTLRQRCRR